jgi:hypothetical protein
MLHLTPLLLHCVTVFAVPQQRMQVPCQLEKGGYARAVPAHENAALAAKALTCQLAPKGRLNLGFRDIENEKTDVKK